MPGGLLALFDDVAVIARSAAASVDDVAVLTAQTSAKAAGVVIDDAAVTPQYVQDVSPARELPMIWKITKGSLRNKLVFILPVALLLNAVAPWALVPILMLGGTYLCFEGVEKIVHSFASESHMDTARGADKQPADEDALVASAIRTDLILSAEIMIISLDEVKDFSIWIEVAVLFCVGIFITFAVYGAVGLLVKIDDIGLGMIRRGRAKGLGHALVKAMPYVLTAISIIGTVAMLWVGGHLIIRGFDEVFGWHFFHEVINTAQDAVGGGAFLSWLAETGISLLVGLVAGLIAVGIVTVVKKLLPATHSSATTNEGPQTHD